MRTGNWNLVLLLGEPEKEMNSLSWLVYHSIAETDGTNFGLRGFVASEWSASSSSAFFQIVLSTDEMDEFCSLLVCVLRQLNWSRTVAIEHLTLSVSRIVDLQAQRRWEAKHLLSDGGQREQSYTNGRRWKQNTVLLGVPPQDWDTSGSPYKWWHLDLDWTKMINDKYTVL